MHKQDGDLILVNLKVKDETFKVQWINRLHGQDQVLTQLAYYNINLKIKNELFWECNYDSCDIQFACKASGFWLSVVKAWSKYNYNVPEGLEQIVNRIMWLNSHIRVQGKPYYDHILYEIGII